MAFTEEEWAEFEPQLETFIEQQRPREEIRDQVDLGYKVEDQSVIIHEIRPQWDNPDKKMEPPVAKATWVRSRELWKIYWLRANLEWDSYDPKPEVGSLKLFLEEVRKDPHHAFWG